MNGQIIKKLFSSSRKDNNSSYSNVSLLVALFNDNPYLLSI